MIKSTRNQTSNDEPVQREVDRIVVTGTGICSAIGNSVEKVVERLRSAQSNARPITRFSVEPFLTKIAAEVDLPKELLPDAEVRRDWDRGTLMAVIASKQAIQQSGLSGNKAASLRIGVATGMSGSGQFQTARVDFNRKLLHGRRTADVIFDKNIPSYQAEQIATHFGFTGPQTSVSSASAGSGIAIGIAMRWLQSERCDAVLVGGSECLSVLNIIGFDVLGITAKGKCRPFSDSGGMMMGEGAGYLMFEGETAARQRGAEILGYADGLAVSADAFDPVLFDPTGNGQQRAMRRALKDGNASHHDVDWLRASGSGGQDQDSAELIAIKELFGDSAPPVTSLEPFFGHCNGAGPAIGLIAAISSMNAGILPPTLNFEGNGDSTSTIDFVPNTAREASLERTLCNSAAFGGTNVAVVCSRTGSPRRPRANGEVVITGVGMLSALGAGGRDSFELFQRPETGICKHDRFEMPQGAAEISGLVRGLKPRKILPQVNLRGVDLLGRYAAIASQLAWNDAQLQPGRYEADRLGVVTGIAHASGKTLESLMSQIYQDFRSATVGKLMLRNGRFMITSQLAHWFSLKGYNSTLASGELSGLHAIATAADQLRHDDELDAVLVVTADEVDSMFTQLHNDRDDLVGREGCMAPHAPESSGRVLGEGAVAIVLERESFAKGRNAPMLAKISGHAMSFHARNSGVSLDETIRLALADGVRKQSDVGFVAGLGTGDWAQDRQELESVQRVIGSESRIVSLSGHTGFMESSSGLFSTAAALSALQSQQHPVSLAIDGEGRIVSSDRILGGHSEVTTDSLVVGQARAGHQVALLLGQPG